MSRMTRSIAGAGAFVVSLDSLVNIALPAMAVGLGVAAGDVRWVIVGYVATYALVSFAGGALGDRLGHGRVFVIGTAVSAGAFVLAATASAYGWLLVARIVQGLGAGLVYGTSPALVTAADGAGGRGHALGFLNGAISLAFTLGPLTAGHLVDIVGWRAVFWIRVPLALGLLAWAAVGLGRAPRRRPVHAIRARDVLRGPVVGLGALAFLANGAIFAVWYLTPFDLVERRGVSAHVGGAFLMLTPLGMTIGAPIAGRLTDRVGPWPPMAASLALEVGGLAALAAWGAALGPAGFGLALFVAGLGFGVFQVPAMAAMMAKFPAGQQGAAGGLAFLARTLGIVTSVAVFGSVFVAVAARAGRDAALAAVYATAAVEVGVAALVGACAILAARWRRATGGSSSRSA
jgi:MFS family permease